MRKKYFDVTVEPIKILFPKSIVKGKRRKRHVFLTHETWNFVKPILNGLKDNDLVFTSNENIVQATATEREAFNYMRNKTGLIDKYSHNHRFKKTIHSFRAFCYTQSKLATGDANYAHGYLGHDRYLMTYERLEQKEKIDMFNRCIPRLSIFENVIMLSQDEKDEKLRIMEQRFEEQQKQLDWLTTMAKNPAISIQDLQYIEN